MSDESWVPYATLALWVFWEEHGQWRCLSNRLMPA